MDKNLSLRSRTLSLRDKIYKHLEVEGKWYSFWEKSGFFTPKVGKNKKPFVIIMPPPNANGELHVGHAVFVTIEDILTRYHRMKGESTLWLPGADHAGILTQVVFEKELEKQGQTRFDLGREEFVKKTYEFTWKNKKRMEDQLRSLGASCDWTREKFTLDPKITKIVYKTFKDLYEDGLIYQGERIINWCIRCGTALSDLEVEHEEKEGKLWFIKYPLKSGGQLAVATTRPETLLGDTAVAVNPKDKRWKNLVGETAILPLIGREIPVIADSRVKMDFGTGAVKVTPAHDSVDFEIGKDHGLKFIQVIGFDGKITKEAGNYAGLTISQAKNAVLEDLKKQNLLEKIQDYKFSAAICERCRSVIEPLVSKQWFVAVAKNGAGTGKNLAKDAISAVKKGKIKIIPKQFEKIYFNWMENIRDWCISRQIWWGQQLPVYYCGERRNEKCKKENGIFVSSQTPKKCPHCGSEKFVQDPDTLDTWFSSGQWPFTALKTTVRGDFERFYPTTVMETGYDILFFWVARMIMLGLYATNGVPFKTVFLHGLVRDEKGQKMSKSKGNVIDPIIVANRYGADAVRFSSVFGASPGRDMNLGEGKIRGMRNFTNKIWNAARFVISNLDGFKKSKNLKPNNSWEKTIETLRKALIRKTAVDLENFQFHLAAARLHNFFWHQFCDILLEESKAKLKAGGVEKLRTQNFLLSFLQTYLLLLHPFMPFVTEELWSKIPKEKRGALIISQWPKV